MRFPLRTALASALLGAALAGCVGAGDDPTDDGDCAGKCDLGDDTGDPPSLCVALRGNGPRLTAHFGALARVIEHYGLVDATAGGSSGSITSFLLESVQMNPLVYDCGDQSCTARERADRAAFLFKSMAGYLEVIAGTDEVESARVLAGIAGRINADGIPGLLESDPEAGVSALRALLDSRELRDLINPEAIELLATSPDPVYHARDLVIAAQGALSFDASDPTILVRPGIVDFDAVADKLGRVATFYAGYQPVDRAELGAVLADCAGPGRGADWTAIRGLPSGDSTCGARFAALVADFRADLLATGASYRSRADDPVGGALPALISTSVLEDDAVAAFQAARADYLAARPVELSIDFDDVRFGYWGRPEDLARVESNPRGFADAKTGKLRNLGAASWRHVLAYSPAEPGLTRALELPDGRVSAGGWSDLQPVQVLRNLGCDRVVFITRRGGGGSFMVGVAGMLGMTEADAHQLLALDDPSSSYYQALDEAAAVMCTDWDTPDAFDIPAMFAEGYLAPMETTDASFTDHPEPYAGVTPTTGQPGCTVGVR